MLAKKLGLAASRSALVCAAASGRANYVLQTFRAPLFPLPGGGGVSAQLTCRDLVSTVNSREFVAQQLGGMTAAIGDARFAQLMATVDPVIVGQLQPFLT